MKKAVQQGMKLRPHPTMNARSAGLRFLVDQCQGGYPQTLTQSLPLSVHDLKNMCKRTRSIPCRGLSVCTGVVHCYPAISQPPHLMKASADSNQYGFLIELPRTYIITRFDLGVKKIKQVLQSISCRTAGTQFDETMLLCAVSKWWIFEEELGRVCGLSHDSWMQKLPSFSRTLCHELRGVSWVKADDKAKRFLVQTKNCRPCKLQDILSLSLSLCLCSFQAFIYCKSPWQWKLVSCIVVS